MMEKVHCYSNSCFMGPFTLSSQQSDMVLTALILQRRKVKALVFTQVERLDPRNTESGPQTSPLCILPELLG